MTLKRKGEVGLEEIYADAPKGVTYTIVRPGGLTDGGLIGPSGEAKLGELGKFVSLPSTR